MGINKEWTFTKSSIGPEEWKDKYSSCNTSFQSPINININNTVRCNKECDIQFSYFSGKCNVKGLINMYKTDNSSKSIVLYLEYQNGSYVIFNNSTYILQKVYFFPGGLHTINKGNYDMEAVLSHIDSYKNVLNISVLINRSKDFGDSQDFFSQWSNGIDGLVNNTETIVNQEKIQMLTSGKSIPLSVDEKWSIDNLLPINRAFYYYLGTQPFPPCNDNIKWIILKESVTIQYNDLLTFLKLGNKMVKGSGQYSGQYFSNPMRSAQPNPSYVSGKKVERIIYENINTNNGKLTKEKIYIKCQKLNNQGGTSSTPIAAPQIGGFYNSGMWKFIKLICYMAVYILAIYYAYKAIKWLYKPKPGQENLGGPIHKLQNAIGGNCDPIVRCPPVPMCNSAPESCPASCGANDTAGSAEAGQEGQAIEPMKGDTEIIKPEFFQSMLNYNKKLATMAVGGANKTNIEVQKTGQGNIGKYFSYL